MPESRYKYLYERLGDQNFQTLVSALLSQQFQNYQALPLRQADGGRDGIRRDGQDLLVFQVKWSVSGQAKDPVQWLSSVVNQELESIRALREKGASKYVLVTNIPSTGKPGSGTFDRLQSQLDQHSQEIGIEMSCVWRETLDALVDASDRDLKWAYAEMLAGWDLIRYLVSEEAKEKRDDDLRSVLTKVASAQWHEDSLIKFSQAEIDREQLNDLFVDVEADRIHSPHVKGDFPFHFGRVGGAANYLTNQDAYPYTLVHGAPGQGKSTLTQYVSQAYRAPFLTDLPAASTYQTKEPRFPLRIDLSDYAAWRQGYDVFDQISESASVKGPKKKKRPAQLATVECFLADFIAYKSGNAAVDSAAVTEILDRLPTLLVLDGLDEVGSGAERRKVVQEVNQFCARGRAYAVPPRVIVTTRPNSGDLAEPDRSLFEVISLSPLSPGQRDRYLIKWCAVHGVTGENNKRLRRNFTQKTRQPHVDELAGNPMQLTILLQLLRHHGDATPTQRTELYDAYMDMLFAREANKHPDSVRKYRSELQDIVPFLGWYLQSRAEEEGHSGRMSISDLKAAMKHFQTTYGKQSSVVDKLFEAATDRLWALTSKEQGTFEFEVQSLREYFAAKYLFESAGEDNRHFDQVDVLRELLRRPYWQNTLRFYGGNATGSYAYVLKDGVLQEMAQTESKQSTVAAWMLVTDGVFDSRPLHAEEVIDCLFTSSGIGSLLEALDRNQISPLPVPSHGERSWQRLTELIRSDPSHPETSQRTRAVRELLGRSADFNRWWIDHYPEYVGTPQEKEWLRLGASCEAARSERLPIPGGTELDGETAQLLLNTGCMWDEPRKSEVQRLILDGHCSQTTSSASEEAQIAAALSPAEYFRFGAETEIPLPQSVQQRPNLRSQAIQALRRVESKFVSVAEKRRFGRGEKGSTFPWANSALALNQLLGRCWLATEIAIIGAASPLNDGFPVQKGTDAFGSASNPATLVAETRRNRGNADWWLQQLAVCKDELSSAEWALALWAIASPEAIEQLRSEWEDSVLSLSAERQRVLLIAAARIGNAGFLRGRQCAGESEHPILDELYDLRRPNASEPHDDGPQRRRRPTRPLAAVAREKGWFKIDTVGHYR